MTSFRPIYLDHNATTPVRAEVVRAMADVLADIVGNPSSTHAAGRRARAVVEEARQAVAALLGAGPDEIVFVSGGTEGDNLAIRGLALAARQRRRLTGGHLVSSPLEHPAVKGALDELVREGFAVTWLPVGDTGAIDPAVLQAALRPDTVLVSLAAVNHELGNWTDVAALAAVARAGGALFHTDAVAAAGRVSLPAIIAAVDAATVSAHKLGGPKGVGAVFVRRGVDLHPVLAGGHQEHDRRPGTENVAAIAGFGVAAQRAAAELPELAARLVALRARLEAGLRAGRYAIAGARVQGDVDHRAPGTTNVAFAGASGQLVAINLDLEGICVSTGAACTSGSLQPSAVLMGLGQTAAQASEAIRISLGRTTTDADVARLLEVLPGVVARVRAPASSPAPAARPHISGGRERVVVAMSGGVDSSTAAAMLCQAGVDVVGVTLKLYNAAGTAASVGGRCCSPRDIQDARATAAQLGFPHYVIDESDAFRRAVIDDFVDQHRIGRTPNPCVRCNEKLKFGPLLAFADAIGAAALATGHYARLRDDAGAPQLLRAIDRDKDQSYFLFGVRPEILARVRFPLGALTKDDVRAVARRAGLANADKPDSQQICFIPDGDHKRFVEAHGGAGATGVIRDESGARLAEHGGTHRFTIGQRKGVPAASGQRRFVLRVEPSSGDVIVGPRSRLGRQGLHVDDVRWLDAAVSPPIGRRRCEVQIRHHAAAAPGWIAAAGASGVEVQLDTPAMGVAPGQAAVFYDGDRVLGGGWIADAG